MTSVFDIARNHYTNLCLLKNAQQDPLLVTENDILNVSEDLSQTWNICR